MPVKLIIVAVTVTAVIGQLLLRRAAHGLGTPTGLAGLPHFFSSAVVSPWIYASVSVQILGYVLWLLLVGREKLGVATAGVGAGYFTLTALSAWWVYGESLSALQWVGIVLVTVGVTCVSLGRL
jgi:drug/metabolite transporter (DMT)-like permease